MSALEAQRMLQETKAMEERMLAELPWLAPIGALVLAAVIGVVLALALPRGRQGAAGAWVAASHLAAAGLAGAVWLDRGLRRVMEGTVVVDGLALATTGVLGVAGAVCVALARPVVAGTDREGEFYAVLGATTLAGAVLAHAGDVALIAIALGLLSLGSFVLTGYVRGARRANEASLKYYIYGTVSGAAMLYGFSWWFGLAGSTGLRTIGEGLAQAPQAAVVASTALVVAGLGYKAALVPFHFWTPDVYDGAPLPVAAYLSVLPKIAGIVALARVLPLALPGDLVGWTTAMAVVAAATMVVGTLAAIPQTSVVRLLAYSSIAQSGFLLMGVAALEGSPRALPALVFYAIAYAAANLAAFAVVLAVQRERGSVDVAAFAGLGHSHPWWTAALILALLSLFGLPPLAGFVAKLEIFTAAIDAGQAWLAVIGIVVTVISLYPYLRVAAPTVLSGMGDPGARRPALRAGPALAGALAIAAVLTVLVGVAAEPFLSLAEEARAMGGR